uniref:Uncharacterized protein n=1 Tax=Anguilla anguilla TaxID=7936 RepID=A0A0E9PPJ0_ANGAN
MSLFLLIQFKLLCWHDIK